MIKLDASHLDVACVELDPSTSDLVAQLAALLSESEKSRARDILSGPFYSAYVAAHGLRLRMASIVSDTGVHPLSSLSHADGLAACAYGFVSAIGVDVERMDGGAVDQTVVARILADTERPWFERGDPMAQRAMFVRLWTLKEAFSKAVGLGLALDFRDIGFALDQVADRVALIHCPASLGPPESWRFAERALGRSHRLAVAYRQNGAVVEGVRWRPLSLHGLIADLQSTADSRASA
ncbi:hypothetical protein BH10PSE12_BH10PSE12_29840 [soil metagenome]